MIRTGDILLNAYRAGIAVPAFNVPYLPMVEPVIRAVVDQDAFALIETARLEWIKFEAGGPEPVMAEFTKWQQPGLCAAASRSCAGHRRGSAVASICCR